jgi:hypothetical protein
MTDEVLIEAFEAGQDPPGGFHHREHVRAAWWYVCRHPLPEALSRFRTGLKRFAAAQGKPERYHETITAAYVVLIHERLSSMTRGHSWDEFAAAHPDLLTWTPSILDRYYEPATLASDDARRGFVLPDRERFPVLEETLALAGAGR